MAPAWFLAPCLVVLRGEFNALSPGRDKRTDGSVGDEDHAARASDHNPDARGMVHAIDVDHTGPWPRGLTMHKIVRRLADEHRAGRDKRLTLIIYNRQKASVGSGWAWVDYDGSNPHTEHAHFSASSVLARENDTRPFSLEDLTMTTPAQTWGHDIDPSSKGYSAGGALWTMLGRTDILNRLPGQIQETYAKLAAQVAADDDDLDAMAAAIALTNSKLDEVLLHLARIEGALTP
jgi:hypothetical protein